MKLYYIIKNVLKRNLKNYKNIGQMLVFPILLTFIFITVFGNIENQSKANEIGAVRLQIYSQADTSFNEMYLKFLDEVNLTGSTKLIYHKTESIALGQKALQEGEADVLAAIDRDTNIALYQGDGKMPQLAVIGEITQSFGKSTALYKLTARNNLTDSENYANAAKQQNNIQNQRSNAASEHDNAALQYEITKLPKPAYNYYVLSIAATMIAFTVLLAGSYGCSGIHYIYGAAGKRVQSAPLSKNIIYLGEYIGGLILTLIQGGIIAVIIESVFNIGLKNNITQIIIILSALSLMSVALGVCIGTLFQEEKTSEGIISIVTMLLCFTSGGFNPNVDVGKIAALSPISSVNKGITDICMGRAAENLNEILSITISITLICLLLSAFKINISRKEPKQDEKHDLYCQA